MRIGDDDTAAIAENSGCLVIHDQCARKRRGPRVSIGIPPEIGDFMWPSVIERCDLADFQIRRAAQFSAEQSDDLAEAVSAGARIHAITVGCCPPRVDFTAYLSRSAKALRTLSVMSRRGLR